MDWHWILLDADGSPTDAPSVAAPDQRFPSQSEAETWLGETWPALRGAGVAAVTLQESQRTVYGPMSLHPGR